MEWKWKNNSNVRETAFKEFDFLTALNFPLEADKFGSFLLQDKNE